MIAIMMIFREKGRYIISNPFNHNIHDKNYNNTRFMTIKYIFHIFRRSKLEWFNEWGFFRTFLRHRKFYFLRFIIGISYTLTTILHFLNKRPRCTKLISLFSCLLYRSTAEFVHKRTIVV